MREKKKNTSGKNHMKKFQKKKAELLDIWHLYSNNKNITSENIEVSKIFFRAYLVYIYLIKNLNL